MEDIISINSISQYVAEIIKLDMRDPIPPHRTYHYFRGHANSNWELLPAIARDRQYSVDISVLDEERNLIESAKNEFPQIFSDELRPVDLLATLQHYGIPTRLLDITSNALVALYFACQNNDVDGEVFVFHKETEDITIYPIQNAIADSYRFLKSTASLASVFYSRIIEQPYALEQKLDYKCLHKAPDDGARWIKECCENPLFTRTRYLTQRQKLQQGSFILFPNQIEENENGEIRFKKMIGPLKKDAGCIVKRIKVPSGAKKDLRKNLSLFGVSESSLFADNIDMVCKGIVNEFSLVANIKF